MPPSACCFLLQAWGWGVCEKAGVAQISFPLHSGLWKPQCQLLDLQRLGRAPPFCTSHAMSVTAGGNSWAGMVAEQTDVTTAFSAASFSPAALGAAICQDRAEPHPPP